MRALIFVAALASCTPYDPSLPTTPFFCNSSDSKCPDGYTCIARATGSAVCTDLATTDAGGSGSGSCGATFTGVLATWDLTGQPGTQVSTAATSSATGVVAAPLARSAALTPSAGTNSISATGWPTATSVDPQSYFTFGLAPPAGCTLAVTSAMLDVKASNTGPIHAALATSADTFSQQASVDPTTPGAITLTATGTGMLELRLYGFAASASTGTMRVQNQLTVTGSLQ